MFREIKKKMLILENRKPYSREVIASFDEINLIDWVYSSMNLDGCSISKQVVEKILKGHFIEEASVSDHLSIENYKKTIKLEFDMADMEIDLNIKYIFKIYKTLVEDQPLEYRKSNPILKAFNYNPPHPKEIEEQMDILVKWIGNDNCDNNPILKAAYLHNKFIEIYPFEVHSEAVARMLMNYELIRNSFPPVGLNISRKEYNDAIILYLKNEDIKPIYNALIRSIFNKLELMLQITEEC
ncbi:Fic family protein [Anaerovorax odorimutans]|uniref:Fic family protein n=1 Tax=Anaerovorax odorimutans TaxID=109327 RepID=UPI00041CC905|nr:Fic family protein [Anaerovorax odorimutans]